MTLRADLALFGCLALHQVLIRGRFADSGAPVASVVASAMAFSSDVRVSASHSANSANGSDFTNRAPSSGEASAAFVYSSTLDVGK